MRHVDESLAGVDPLRQLVGGHTPVLTPAERERMDRSAEVVRRATRARAVYGRTTGVGANRQTTIQAGERGEQDLRLLRSHASGTGPLLADADVRAMIGVRLAQLRFAGSGLGREAAEALMHVLERGDLPRIHARGGVGTGDLSALAEVGLALAGEVPFASGEYRELWRPQGGEALAFMSSNALTTALAARVVVQAEDWLDHCAVVTAASLLAVGGSDEPFALMVHEARPHWRQQGVAAAVRRALEGQTLAPRRVQDSFGFRAMPQVVAPLADAVARLRDAVQVEMNSAPENPLVHDAGAVLHNGNFHAQTLALQADGLALALAGAAQLSLARTGDLLNPAMTGLAPFLSDGKAGSSGLMLTEYMAAAALARLRGHAAPATLGSAVISLGTEDHASFAPAAVDQALAALGEARVVLACELLAATRALGMGGAAVPERTPLGRYLADVPAGPSVADRPLSPDIDRIVAFLGAGGPHGFEPHPWTTRESSGRDLA